MNAPRRTVLVAVVAVLGIAIAAAITWGTSQLVRQRIGLASEPLTAGRRLLPPAPTPAHSGPTQVTRSATGKPATGASTRTRPAPTTPSPPATTTAAPSSAPPPPVTTTAAPSSASSRPSEEPPVEHRPTVRGSQDGGGDSSSHRDD